MRTQNTTTGAGNTTAAQTTDIDTFINNPRMQTLTTKSGIVMGDRKAGAMHIYLGGKQDAQRKEWRKAWN